VCDNILYKTVKVCAIVFYCVIFVANGNVVMRDRAKWIWWHI